MKKTKSWLILILLVAAFLRFYRLGEYPVGFHIDEASLGYNAYSLLKTGRDENGHFLPLHINMFGDFRPSGYQFLDILPVALLGLNEFSTRFPSALFGALTPLALFLLAKSLFGSEKTGLIAAGLIAVSPWHLVISRASAETIVALFLIVIGAFYFGEGLKKKKKSLKWGVVFWSLSLFFYHSSRIFVPALGIVFLLLTYQGWFKEKERLKVLFSLGAVIALAVLLVFGAKGGGGRFEQVSIFHFPEIRLVMEEQFREDGVNMTPLYLVRLFHNKPVNYGLGFLNEYFRYFSPRYLFIEGGLPMWYHVPQMGLMYLIELPFLLIGIHLLVRKKIWLPLFWLILGPLVAGVTRDDVPNVQRSLVMLPALILITAYGLGSSWQWVKKKENWQMKIGLVSAILFGLGWHGAYFSHQYLVHAKRHRPWYRFNGFKEMVLTVRDLDDDFDKVIVSKIQGGTYMHFLFFLPFEPKAYQALGSPRDQDFGGFGKYHFVPQECPTQLPAGLVGQGEKVLYVASGLCDQPQFVGADAIKIEREDGTVAFRIASFQLNAKEEN